MPRGGWYIVVAVVGCLAALGLGIRLQPEQPKLSGDGGYQAVAGDYRAGGAQCEPAALNRLAARQRQAKTDACSEAEEQHREAADSLIEARRQADAADTSAVLTYQQTGIAAWGATIGLLTLLAAIAAAFFAERAAHHTSRGATEAAKASGLAQESLDSTRLASEAELRPWITIRPIIRTFDFNEERIVIETEFVIQNIGQTVAHNVFTHVQVAFLAHGESVSATKKHFASFDNAPRISAYALLPGDEARHFNFSDSTTNLISWKEGDTETAASVNLILAVSASYQTQFGPEQKITQQAFVVGKKGCDIFDQRHIFRDMGGTVASDLVINRFMSGRIY